MTDDDDTPPIRILSDEELLAHYRSFPPGTPTVRMEKLMIASHETECNARHERTDAAVTSLLTSRRAHTRNLWVIASALFGALITVSLYATDKISSSAERTGETRAEIRALQKQIDDVIIRLNKLAIIDPKAVTIVQADIGPAATCGGGCTVSQDCSDVFSQCRYCYQGRCSSILPALPTPSP